MQSPVVDEPTPPTGLPSVAATRRGRHAALEPGPTPGTMAGPGNAGRASAGAARYTGPLLLSEPPPPPRGLRHKITYGVTTVVLFVIAAFGLYKITMPDRPRPVPAATDEAAGSGATAPVPPSRPAGGANPSASRPVPHPTGPLRDGIAPS